MAQLYYCIWPPLTLPLLHKSYVLKLQVCSFPDTNLKSDLERAFIQFGNILQTSPIQEKLKKEIQIFCPFMTFVKYFKYQVFPSLLCSAMIFFVQMYSTDILYFQ